MTSEKKFKNNKKNYKAKPAGKQKQWTGKKESVKYTEKKKTDFKKNTAPKGEQKKAAPKKTEAKKPATKSLCPVHGKCGGCQLLDMPYEQQLKRKQTEIAKLLKPYCQVEKII